MLAKITIGLCVLAVAGGAYVRLSPADLTSFTTSPAATEPGDTATMNSFKAVRQITASGADIMQAVDQVALQSDRTKVASGAAAEGLVTYVTRSALMGYPDYTTVTVVDTENGPLLVMRAQSRFGKSDLGVNRARVEAWLTQLGPLVVPAS
ncbi:DUF1499 domain-containing protein [Loktanella sp. R86503]|uniref:DUF1499 domain-containing protein n=1 Tax=Loktanella TaxID=245186 RepID=UPI0036D9D0BA